VQDRLLLALGLSELPKAGFDASHSQEQSFQRQIVVNLSPRISAAQPRSALDG
jgi:hypothetical protein